MADEELQALRQENLALKQEIERLKDGEAKTEKLETELWSHEVYLSARKKMFSGVLTVVALLSALGLFTVWEAYKQVRDESEKMAAGIIAEKVEKEIDVADITRRVMPVVERKLQAQVGERVEGLLKSEVDKLVQETKMAVDAAKAEARSAMGQAVAEARQAAEEAKATAIRETGRAMEQQSTEAVQQARVSLTNAVRSTEAAVEAAKETDASQASRMYFVVAGSSPVPSDLEAELERVTRLAQSNPNKVDDPRQKFPGLAIYPPNEGNTNYALVVGGPLPVEQARKLKAEAVDYGFRDDTFLWVNTRKYFKDD